MPARGDDPVGARAFAERPVAVVPEQLVVLRRRDEEIGVTVPVEVGGDAPFAAHGTPGARGFSGVDEPSMLVAEEGGARKSAVRRIRTDVAFPVAIDDEEIEPAVVVVVEPAEPAAHHRGDILRYAVPERA